MGNLKLRLRSRALISTKYYVRAIALRGLECYYGEEKDFTTEVVDDEGNEDDEMYCPSVAVLIGDGELETATALASLNLNKLLRSEKNGRVLPILHLNGYKISAPTIYGRSSERELLQLFRGFGYDPIIVDGTNTEEFQTVLQSLKPNTFIIMKTPKGYTGPKELNGVKLEGNCASHQVPLPDAKTDRAQLEMLENWLKSYNFKELYHEFAHED